MYSSGKRDTIQVVTIDFVDINKREVFCSSKDGGRFTLKIPVGDGVYRIPKSGENWIIHRENINNWSFQGVIQSGFETSVAGAQEGDLVIESPSEVKMSTRTFYLNGVAMGVWTMEEFSIEGGTTRSLEIANTPTSDIIQVFNNGLLIPPSGIIIVEQVLLFSEALDAGWAAVYYTRFPEQ
jgi:hypothetical protein